MFRCTHLHTHGHKHCRHTHKVALWVIKNVKKRITLSPTQKGNLQYKTGAPCNMCHHRTQLPGHSGAPKASKQPSQTGAGLKHSNSHHPIQSQTTARPRHHYPQVSCIESMCPVWKIIKCLLGHNAESLQRKCFACCFAQRRGYVCLQQRA